ncbi:galactokinase [Demequina sp.]|uniref:galactokinase n=1 Tax=Demequina sp. TaxID=2050685 RepID=UPI003D10F84A
MSDAAQRASDQFAAEYGRQPEGVWSAPGRVNLIGEHTDYNGGLVLPFAIDRRTYCAVARREDRVLRVRSATIEGEAQIAIDDLAPEALDGWSAYALGVAWAISQPIAGEPGADLAAASGLDIFLTSEVPLGAGLSSSAAIECAVAVALNELWGLGLDRMALARAGRLAENVAVGAPTGIMDQCASLLGEEDHAVFLDCGTESAESVPLHLDREHLSVLVIDTGVRHEHATGGYGDRRASCERGAEILNVPSLRFVLEEDLPRAASVLDEETYRRVRHVVTESARVASTVRTLQNEGPQAIGDLLLASHASMRDDFEISVPELDLAVESAVRHGALGARMTGGGFGGAAIALVASDAVGEIAAKVTEDFSAAGFGAPRCFKVVPSDGAHRDI